MGKTVIMYPKLRRYLQNMKKNKQITYVNIADSMNLHTNVVTSWFCGLRFPRASNILLLARALGSTEDEQNQIAMDILTIATEE